MSCSRLRAGTRAADVGISPEDVQKGQHELLDTCQRTESGGRNTAAEDLTPAPSVVIAWVLRDVVDWKWQPGTDEHQCLRRELQLAAHAARLLHCWETRHGEEFAKAFAAELSVLVDDLHQGGNLPIKSFFKSRLS